MKYNLNEGARVTRRAQQGDGNMRKLLCGTAMLRAGGRSAMPAAAQDCPITIGMVMELTGPAGAYGQAGAKAAEMALRDFNEAGGARAATSWPTCATARARATWRSTRRRSSSTSRRCR